MQHDSQTEQLEPVEGNTACGPLVVINIKRVVIKRAGNSDIGEVARSVELRTILRQLGVIARRQDWTNNQISELGGLIMTLSERSQAGFQAVTELIGKLDTDITTTFQGIMDQNAEQRTQLEAQRSKLAELDATIAQMRDDDTNEDAAFTAQIEQLQGISDTLRGQLETANANLSSQDDAIAGGLQALTAQLGGVDSRLGTLIPPTAPAPTPAPPAEPPTDL